ncbi:NAD(P)-dependent oxidoreductase [Nostoc sp. 3335mG]|nr:NAD(P)-dependent oxidoreductase [Nostoc sp. 3335mG]
MDVGFIGLGQMGHGMARRLIDAGHAVTVWNRDPSRAAALASAGVNVAGSPAEAASAGVVITMLANDAALEAVSFGKDGILSAGPGVVHISCSTVSVALTERLTRDHATANQQFLAAPVLGRPDAAASGKLVILPAGNRDMIDLCAPLFAAIGEKVLPMGARPAMAAASKLAANFSLAAIIETMTEAFAIAGAGGVSAEALLVLFGEVNFGTRMIGAYGKIIASGAFEPAAFPLTLGRKDIGLGLDAVGAEAEAPIARLLADRMDALISHGRGERDWASLGQPLPQERL